MALNFADRLVSIQEQHHTNLALLLAPRLVKLPLVIQRYDDPFLPYGTAIVNATRDLVCAYVFDLAAYLGLGAAGAIALERTIAYAGGDALTVLHGPFVGSAYAALLDETSFNADAITIADAADSSAYDARTDRCAFIVRRGLPQPDELLTGAIFWQDAGLFTIPYATAFLTVRLAGEDVLYAGMGEDFAEQTRAALEQRR
ncbi:MAG: hypothetical protein HZC41_18220 [Chloroflexi bacterium]|nr:hypothetical protein [Chloroflexota bacterium]